jgi:hypothetical protein
MRTYFQGALHEVRPSVRFPLSVEGVLKPDQWRASAARLRESENQDGFAVRDSSVH